MIKKNKILQFLHDFPLTSAGFEDWKKVETMLGKGVPWKNQFLLFLKGGVKLTPFLFFIGVVLVFLVKVVFPFFADILELILAVGVLFILFLWEKNDTTTTTNNNNNNNFCVYSDWAKVGNFAVVPFTINSLELLNSGFWFDGKYFLYSYDELRKMDELDRKVLERKIERKVAELYVIDVAQYRNSEKKVVYVLSDGIYILPKQLLI